MHSGWYCGWCLLCFFFFVVALVRFLCVLHCVFKVFFYSTPSTEHKYAYIRLCALYFPLIIFTLTLQITLYKLMYVLSSCNLRTPARHAVILGLLYPIRCQHLTHSLFAHIFKEHSAKRFENIFTNFTLVLIYMYMCV